VDEDCVNAELDLGKPLGHFSLINNCQTFVSRVIKRCLISKLKPKEIKEEVETEVTGEVKAEAKEENTEEVKEEVVKDEIK
jgi:hypothetical protein